MEQGGPNLPRVSSSEVLDEVAGNVALHPGEACASRHKAVRE
jgi:hypothetical protein